MRNYVTHFLVGVVFCVSSASVAQETETLAVAQTRDFSETFDPLAKVSGIPLTGLRIGGVKDNLDINKVLVTTMPDSGDQICVEARTRDGRFRSKNLYTVTSNGVKPARLSPVTVKHDEILSGYEASDFVLAVHVANGEDCNDPNPTYVPQVGSTQSDTLTILINSRSRRAEATLTAEPGTQPLKCEVIRTGANIAFDTRCTVEAENFRGLVSRLDIVLDDGFETLDYDYSVYIPAKTP